MTPPVPPSGGEPHAASARPGAVIRLLGDELEVDLAAARLLRAGTPVALEPRSYDLLVYLLEHRDRLVTKEDLHQQVWGGAFVTDNALDRAMARLRSALGDDVRSPRYVETVPGRGYRWVAEVEIQVPSAAAGDRESFGGARSPAPAGVAPPPATPPAAAPPSAAASLSGPDDRGRAATLSRALVALAAASAAVLALVIVAIVRRADAPAVPAPAERPAVGALVPRQLTSSQSYEYAPSFSPDGASVAFLSNAGGEMAVWVRPLQPGGREVRVSAYGAHRVAWSPDGRWIAYGSYDGVWIVPPTGGTPRQLTDRGSAPAWSPDGETLVYQLLAEGVDINSFASRRPSTLWSVGLDGAPPVRLTEPDQPSGGHGQPSFSPDGRRVVFVAAGGASHSGLWTMTAQGGDLQLLLGGCGCRDPVFSRDGRSVYYTDLVEGAHGLWQVELTARAAPRRLLQAPLRFLALAPDGTTLAASQHELRSNLWALAIEPGSAAPAGEAGPVTRDTNYRNMTPVVSPDGERIIFLAARTGSRPELWMMDRDGGKRTLLVASATPVGSGSPIGLGWPAWSADGHAAYFVDGQELRRVEIETLRVETVLRTELPWEAVAVAPDGQAVAFSLPKEGGPGNVWVLELDGSMRQVTRETGGAGYPIWSPDGRQLAVELHSQDGLHCAVVDAAGGEPRVLTGGAEECYTGGWSPDGDKVLTVRRSVESPIEHWNVWWASVSTGELRQLTFRPPHVAREFVRYPSWSPDGGRIYFELAQSSADIWLFDLPE